MGDIRKPTALKKLAGNPGKRPLPDNEPVYADTSTSPPKWLNKRAANLWNTYAHQLANNGMLNETNREFLAAYCQLVASFIEEQEAGKAPDLKKLQQMRLMAREFGFTPSSQAGVSAPAKPKETDGKARFFN
ncbi:MAG: hypothetical protein Q4D61_01205 [Cardiobacteriaceae bacterium]|nr:hypothetical protein [Cardiobacteriaceae bacterium]